MIEEQPSPPCTSREMAGAQLEAIYNEDGVDLTLIRWTLSLTPAERLDALRQSAHSLARLCNDGSVT